MYAPLIWTDLSTLVYLTIRGIAQLLLEFCSDELERSYA